MFKDQYTPKTCERTRRTLLATVGMTAFGGLAGCIGGEENDNGDTTETSSVPGLQLSLRADVGVTTDDQGQVTKWADQSGNGYDFSPPRAEARPGLTEETSVGTPALSFNGDGQFLLREDTAGIANDSARTFVIACRLTDTAERSPFFMQGKFNATDENANAYGVEANTYRTAGERFGVYLISVANDSERGTDTNYHIHTIQTESFPELEEIRNTTTYYVDGTETSFAHTGGGAFNSPFDGTASAVGAFPQENPGASHTGEIAEIRAYNRALSDDERSAVESTMADRYGIDI